MKSRSGHKLFGVTHPQLANVERFHIYHSFYTRDLDIKSDLVWFFKSLGPPDELTLRCCCFPGLYLNSPNHIDDLGCSHPVPSRVIYCAYGTCGHSADRESLLYV